MYLKETQPFLCVCVCVWILHLLKISKSQIYKNPRTRLFYGEGMATHSSVLAWKIPGIMEPGGLPSMGSHRIGHNWSELAAAAAAADNFKHWHNIHLYFYHFKLTFNPHWTPVIMVMIIKHSSILHSWIHLTSCFPKEMYFAILILS